MPKKKKPNNGIKITTQQTTGGKNTKQLSTKKSHRVGLIRDTKEEFPGLWLEVWLAGDGPVENALFRRMFTRAGCRGASSPETADLIVFGGGSDITPALYGQQRHSDTHTYLKRDLSDLRLWKIGVEKGIPMTGICRGMQFGHVMCGGELYQHVNNHNGQDHGLWDMTENRIIHSVSSVHHQMCQKHDKIDVVACISGKSTQRYVSPTTYHSHKTDDIEAIWCDTVAFFGVQGHPEYRNYTTFANWYLDKLGEFIVANPDISLTEVYDDEGRKVGKYNRLSQKFLDTRKDDHLRDIDASIELIEGLLEEVNQTGKELA